MADLQAPGTRVLVPNVVSKRQRRPSVRLNEIGDQSADSYLRKSKHWRTGVPEWGFSKTRPLGNLTRSEINSSSVNNADTNVTDNGVMDKTLNSTLEGNVETKENQEQFQRMDGGGERNQNSIPVDEYNVVSQTGAGVQAKAKSGVRKTRHGKGRRGGSRGRFPKGSIAARVSPEGEDGFNEHFSNASYEAETPEAFRDFEMETSDSPPGVKESSDLRADSGGFDVDRDEILLERRDQGENWAGTSSKEYVNGLSVEYMNGNGLGLPSDTDTRSKHDVNGGLVREKRQDSAKDTVPVPNNVGYRPGLENGVTLWLNGLGLGRYSQLFEMHEVDTEVLPMLTLEDLRDMGVSAVGSRRKMYNAIQKLQKNFAV
eukprot:TRINITY_DN19556_c0_g1_i1.p1 TRINITY_DN19556_c0_g1~~TRINITY_DN19556_c0_g1_i1.p1  ORF type:complete len:372 (-),score=66.91 TRINITY_DN19556_c0_g1_i1:166-1281(-)